MTRTQQLRAEVRETCDRLETLFVLDATEQLAKPEYARAWLADARRRLRQSGRKP